MTDTTPITTTTDRPIPNRELFGEVREWIITSGMHRQRNWETCAGGIAIKIVSGKEFVSDGRDKLIRDGVIPQESTRSGHEGEVPELREAAAVVLGLPHSDGDDLFDCFNNAMALWMVSLYADGGDPQEWFTYAASLDKPAA